MAWSNKRNKDQSVADQTPTNENFLKGYKIRK
jgi:hypothetical protein